MTQEERLDYLIRALLLEREDGKALPIPKSPADRRRFLRALMNVRPPAGADSGFLRIQDAFLREETAAKGITRAEDLTPVRDGISLWKGDITTLAADAIVNAANSRLLGCFSPCHRCVDNAIHSAAGIQLRLECARIMERQGFPEPPGRAKLTGAYNLPSRFVLHTVGPFIVGRITGEDRRLLADCYRSCLGLAAERRLKTVAFCCISTGEFHFPGREAAEIAVRTVQRERQLHGWDMEVIFNVFQDRDYEIYRQELE